MDYMRGFRGWRWVFILGGCRPSRINFNADKLTQRGR
jgi:hypothetical protein